MSGFKLKSDVTFRSVSKRITKNVRTAVQSAAYGVAGKIRKDGRADIKKSGRFNKSAKGLKAFKLGKRNSYSGNTIVRVTLNRFLAVFEEGNVTIRPKKGTYLWIPIGDRKLTVARNYREPLFMIMSKKGTPLLITKSHEKGRPGEIKYYGIRQVVEPKLFHIKEVAENAAEKAAEYYNVALVKFENQGQETRR